MQAAPKVDSVRLAKSASEFRAHELAGKATPGHLPGERHR